MDYLFLKIWVTCPIAISLIYHSLEDWKNDQTITSLDSISHPIQNVQFPTVTVCPNEQKAPDNWSFMEKYLNAIAFSGSNIEYNFLIESVKPDFSMLVCVIKVFSGSVVIIFSNTGGLPSCMSSMTASTEIA